MAAIRAFDPEIAVVHSDFPPLGWKSLKKGRKLILSAHNTYWPMGLPPKGPKARLKRYFLERQAQALDGAVCTSAECMRQIAEITGRRVRGYVEYPQIVRSYPIEKRAQARRLLYLGRIERPKGIFMLLDAYRTLKAQIPDLTLTFAGSGAAEANLREAIEAEDDDGVRFVGRLGAEEVHNTIAGTDLLVCPTTSAFNEGLALVGFEAAAHGIPSILSSVVPAAELLGSSCIVFEADDTQALTRAIERLATDPAEYARHCQATRMVVEGLYDRSRSWGSQLGLALLEL